MFYKGDIIKFNRDYKGYCPYSITNYNMISARVLNVDENGMIDIKILKHESGYKYCKTYTVEAKYYILKSNINDYLLT